MTKFLKGCWVGLRLGLLVLMISGCADVGFTVFHWPAAFRPVTVLVDPTLPIDCQKAVGEAVYFWETKGVSYLLIAQASPPYKPLTGEVYVQWADLELPMIGRCDRETLGENLLRANILLERCETQLVAHELGHAIGLDHTDDPESLMYPEAGDRWGVAEWEMEAVK